MALTGTVFDIQRAAIHDGPGLRTTVFLKGCPLRCAWCHNPESQSPFPETGQSGKVYGRKMSVAEVMNAVEADRAFYDATGGGLTISGGEPTAQFDFCVALLQAAKERNISTCLDTCGHFPSRYLDVLLPLVDIWEFDYKATGTDEYRRWTGVDGHLILENLSILRKSGARILLRCPIVEHVNETPAHVDALEDFEMADDIESVERLPYHSTGNAKAVDLGRAEFHPPLSFASAVAG